jgi:hypothetical protein
VSQTCSKDARNTPQYGHDTTQLQINQSVSSQSKYVQRTCERLIGYQHLSLLQKLFFCVCSSFSSGAYGDDSFAFGGGRAAVRYGCAPSAPSAASRLASTTRLTNTVFVSRSPYTAPSNVLTRKSLLDIHHLPRTRLHEPTLSLPRPFQPIFRLYLPLPL